VAASIDLHTRLTPLHTRGRILDHLLGCIGAGIFGHGLFKATVKKQTPRSGGASVKSKSEFIEVDTHGLTPVALKIQT
jgi:hypothetical protein